MVKKFLLINKKEGETPLESIRAFLLSNREYKDIKMTYAGRLDPMAEGLMLILTGEECKNKEKYLNLDKEYEFEILFGFKTDTYDILGKVINKKDTLFNKKDLENKIKKELKKFKGKLIQKYPIYSSKTVLGKQLWKYGREKESVEIPEREIYIKNLKFIKLKKISNKNLLKNIEKRINKVNGDFRQKEILKIWKMSLKKENTFYIGEFKIKASSGTYVRSLADNIGENLGIFALAFHIKRTKIGNYAIIKKC